MELKAAGYKGRYLAEYLAVGEAPAEMRNVLRQRSRWAKGHWCGRGLPDQEKLSVVCGGLGCTLGAWSSCVAAMGTWQEPPASFLQVEPAPGVGG